MRTVIRDTTIVSADAGRTVHHDATLVIEDDRIVALDPTNHAANQPGTDVPSYAAVIVGSGLRLVLAQSCSDVVADAVATSAMFSPARADASLQRVAEMIERWHGAEGGRITCCVAAHAPEA